MKLRPLVPSMARETRICGSSTRLAQSDESGQFWAFIVLCLVAHARTHANVRHTAIAPVYTPFVWQVLSPATAPGRPRNAPRAQPAVQVPCSHVRARIRDQGGTCVACARPYAAARPPVPVLPAPVRAGGDADVPRAAQARRRAWWWHTDTTRLAHVLAATVVVVVATAAGAGAVAPATSSAPRGHDRRTRR